jgi:hypothetical protein
MSVNCAASPTRWEQFESVWHIDFEYRQDACHHPVPVCMHAYEERTGTDLWFDRSPSDDATAAFRHRAS